MNTRIIGRAAGAILTGLVASTVIALGQPASAAPSGSANTATGAGVAAPAAAAVAGTSPSRTAKGVGTLAALHLDGACNLYSNGDGDFCLWYLAGFVGSKADFFVADSNLNNNTFITAGAGQGQVVGNNAESDFNYDLNLGARVCTGINSTGTCGTVPPNSGGNFNSTYKNNVESFTWV
jgi:hypothetical protein